MPPRRKLNETTVRGNTFKIGKIVDIYQASSREDDVAVKVVWYYRPEEALGGRKAFHGEKELFESDHTDEVHRNTLIGHCYVHTLRRYEDLPQIGDNDFFTRFVYKPAKKEFEPDKVPVYCTCEQPYNPDKAMVLCEVCKDWFHPECIGLSAESLPQLQREYFCCPECGKAQATKRLRVA